MADPDYHAAIRKGYEWGVKEERERIIALLEAEIHEKDKKRVSGGIDFDIRLEMSQDIVSLRRIIALIEGEDETGKPVNRFTGKPVNGDE